MRMGIGIDTGGTYTDAVVYNFDTAQVEAKGKAPTTREDLSLGIQAAINQLPADLLAQARFVALSTTLATNACVEGKGANARLVLLGPTEKVLRWVDAERRYGLKPDAVLCVERRAGDPAPDWDALFARHAEWLAEAEALGVAEQDGTRNGAPLEKRGAVLLRDRLGVPVIAAGEVAHNLNVLERGATALLNARLLPVIEEFLCVIRRALDSRGITAPALIVRSDGSLMSEALAAERPVETVLSGPAASVQGGARLCEDQNCLIVDMGGTTTDIALVRDGSPVMARQGVRVGGWRTQVRGVLIDTFALGGDSAIRIEEGRLSLCARRVLPLCMAADRWPSVKRDLKRLVDSGKHYARPWHEFLYIVRPPRDLSRCTPEERVLLSLLQDGPRMIAQISEMDPYSLPCGRLEDEGVLMRSGLTLTDMMHILGDFTRYDAETSQLAARYFSAQMPDFAGLAPRMLARAAYDAAQEKLYVNILRMLLAEQYPQRFGDGLDEQMNFLLVESWRRRGKQNADALLSLLPATPLTLVGVGAPIHAVLPHVAQALGARCVIPPHAEVANAVGAALSGISAQAEIELLPIPSPAGVIGYTVCTPDGEQTFEEFDDAAACAETAARRAAEIEARLRGADGELVLTSRVELRGGRSSGGATVDLGATAVARAVQRT